MGTLVYGEQTNRPRHRLRVFGIIAVILIGSFWARYYFTNLEAKNHPTSHADLGEAEQNAQPLLDALNKYHSANGVYPSSFDRLDLTAPDRESYGQAYLYSGRRPDWIFKSDTCPAGEKKLHGWIMKSADKYASEVAQFKRDCIAGYREFQLQSPDFLRLGKSSSLDRWAYYDSFTKRWEIGWCSHESDDSGRIQQSALNGICRANYNGVSDPW